ncbi:MAG: NADH-ubiquinone oxidoreductase-F iron-sulfur binding region domain-containing protein [Planctomycetota bacterium]
MSPERTEIRIGLGSCCQASGSAAVYSALTAEMAAMDADVAIRPGGCIGMCHRVPLIEITTPDGERTMYGNVTPEAVGAILRRHVNAGRPPAAIRAGLRRTWQLLTRDEAWADPRAFRVDPGAEAATAFLGPQVHIVTADYGRMDPTDIDDYRARGGYDALLQAVTAKTAEQLVAEVDAAGLRGRGGAGFPTGRKWDLVRRREDRPKYLVCNGDEGDPGAFMDRMLMEAYPHRILEGLAIAAYAVGAHEAFLYVRQEYPLAVQHLAEAIAAAERAGLLGTNIANSGYDLTVRIKQGAGAFVCGEETALIASLEGRRGMPRLRPPYPADRGLWGKPTLVGNVETYAAVPWILRHGSAAYRRYGTAASTGTKVFALAGKVARGGLIEVPMGMTIRRIVMGIGGGIKRGRAFKAVQIGGPSGGCIPAAMADTPVDYEALLGIGAMMGSGGLVVLDDTDCMVDIARYFLQFTQNESCGKCTFCRIGTKRMLEILDRLCAGAGKAEDLATLEALAHQIKTTSLCGLGQTAPNPVLTTLKYFRDEYEAHLDGRCPAGKCESLVTYTVTDDCIGCALCSTACPADAIVGDPYHKHVIDPTRCTRCHSCVDVCPVDAIRWE